MSWFGRKSRQDAQPAQEEVADAPTEDSEAEGAQDEDAQEEVTTVQEEAAAAEQDRGTRGPLDLSEAPEQPQRIDLGALQLPGREGMELRLEVEDKTQRVTAVTVGMAGSNLQLQVFAAPRTAGVWAEIRAEIAAQVTRQGGTADEVPGVFGRELIARVPVRTPDGRTGHQPSRFVGVDGPRWFLRGVFAGPAAHDPAAAAPLEDVLRSCVVVRGNDAMAPRDLLALRLPAGATRAAPAAPAPAAAPAAPAAAAAAEPGSQDTPQDTPPPRTADDLAPFERGPEITETR